MGAMMVVDTFTYFIRYIVYSRAFGILFVKVTFLLFNWLVKEGHAAFWY